jgi:hypothetical protein
VRSIWQVLLILVVFACTGFSVLYLKKPLLEILGLDQNSPKAAKWAFYLLAFLPLYQVVLLMYGFVFGQFRFFWEFEKRMVQGIRKLFTWPFRIFRKKKQIR